MQFPGITPNLKTGILCSILLSYVDTNDDPSLAQRLVRINILHRHPSSKIPDYDDSRDEGGRALSASWTQ
jgi:hypothetical protein